MKIRINEDVVYKSNEEIIQLLKQGIQFHLLFDGGEALVSAAIAKKESLSDNILADGTFIVANVKEAVKRIKERIETILDCGDIINEVIDEEMGEKIVLPTKKSSLCFNTDCYKPRDGELSKECIIANSCNEYQPSATKQLLKELEDSTMEKHLKENFENAG